MKVHEASKILKKSNKELLAEINDPRVKSHLSKIPEDILAELGFEKKITEAVAEPTKTVDRAETIVVDKSEEELHAELQPVVPVEDCPYTPEQIELGIRCLGNKGPHWKWQHLIGRK